jgi:hypothetical protein
LSDSEINADLLSVQILISAACKLKLLKTDRPLEKHKKPSWSAAIHEECRGPAVVLPLFAGGSIAP